MPELKEDPELITLNNKLIYLTSRFDSSILGIERGFYQTLIRETQEQIEEYVINKIDA